MKGKVEDWVGQVVLLAEFAAANPQVSYAAFTFGLRHRWTYYLRTLRDIEELLEPLESAIGNVLIPALTGHTCTPDEHKLLALPLRLGGLGIENPCPSATKEYEASIRVTAPLVKQIEAQALELPDDDDIRKLQQQNRRETDNLWRSVLVKIKQDFQSAY